MNISFYTASTGAQQTQDRLDIHSNNLANVNTFGFKAKRPTFTQLMTGPIRGVEEDLPRGVGAKMIQADTNFSPSGVTGTDRDLDYAIDGEGFFALLDPVTGQFSYSRDGSFTRSSFQELDDVDVLDADGNVIGTQQEMVTKWYLSDGLGRFVIGQDGGRIEVPTEDAAREMLPVGIFDFVNYNGMQSTVENQVSPVDKNGQVRVGSGKLLQGYLENSNTDIAYEFGKIVETQRAFSYLLRMITVSDELESTVNNLR